MDIGLVSTETRCFRPRQMGQKDARLDEIAVREEKKGGKDVLESVATNRPNRKNHPQKLLAEAIHLREPEKFRESICAGADINAPLHKSQVLPIIALTWRGSASPVFDLFMDLKPKLNVRNNKGLAGSPLSIAVSNCDLKATEFFLAAGASLDWDLHVGGWLYNFAHDDVTDDEDQTDKDRVAIAKLLDTALEKIRASSSNKVSP